MYRDRSPVHHIADLHGEVLLLQGADDLVVPVEQAQLMADAMRAAGKQVELVVYDGTVEIIRARRAAPTAACGQ